jgi:hypothetical protein
MSVRKEFITSVKTKLKELGVFELIDLQKGQFNDPEQSYGQVYTAALIEIDDIQWEAMTNRTKEGKATIRVYLYTKEGFADQHHKTNDPEGGLTEIELQDNVTETLDGYKGNCFKPLSLSREGAVPVPHFGIMGYQLEFTTWVYQRLKQKYVY